MKEGIIDSVRNDSNNGWLTMHNQAKLIQAPRGKQTETNSNAVKEYQYYYAVGDIPYGSKTKMTSLDRLTVSGR